MKSSIFVIACALGLMAAPSAFAADPQLAAPIRQFVDSFNKGDMKAAAATHAADVAIIDEIAPRWGGPKSR